jgi:hypothetical protein
MGRAVGQDSRVNSWTQSEWQGPDMIRIAISAEAFEAIAQTPSFGSVGYEVEAIEGQHYIWLDRAVVDRLGAMRGPGESYNDVILRLAGEG